MWEVSSDEWIVSYEEYSGCRPRRVDAELDPAGRSKDLVGKGLDTVRARLARRSILQFISLQTKFLKSSKFWSKNWRGINFTYYFKRSFWKYQDFAQFVKKFKKDLLSLVFFKHLTFSMIFQKACLRQCFWHSYPNSPTWHQILKPIWMLAAIFYHIYM